MSTENRNVQFDLQEMKSMIKFVIKTNRENNERGIKKRLALQFTGDAGLGKTSAVVQVCQENNMDLCKLNLAQIEELGDLIGFPFKEFQIVKNEDGVVKEKWVSESTLPAWFSAGWIPTDKKPRMNYAEPEWIVDRGESGILLLDDWTRADVRFIQAAMELIDRAEYISWTLPKDWHVILTSNPDNGQYLVNSTDDAQNTRMLSGEVKYNKEVWADWAEKNHIDSRCINFMLMNPEVVTGMDSGDGKVSVVANPRQWENFFLSIGQIKDFTAGINRVETLGVMSVGTTLTHTFLGFIKTNMDKLVEPEFMLKHKDEKEVLRQIKESCTVDGVYKKAIASTLGIRFANWFNVFAVDGTVTDEMRERIVSLITKEVFSHDISYAIAKKIYRKNRNKLIKIVSNKDFMHYITNTSKSGL